MPLTRTHHWGVTVAHTLTHTCHVTLAQTSDAILPAESKPVLADVGAQVWACTKRYSRNGRTNLPVYGLGRIVASRPAPPTSAPPTPTPTSMPTPTHTLMPTPLRPPSQSATLPITPTPVAVTVPSVATTPAQDDADTVEFCVAFSGSYNTQSIWVAWDDLVRATPTLATLEGGVLAVGTLVLAQHPDLAPMWGATVVTAQRERLFLNYDNGMEAWTVRGWV